jgi:hypothetical protein
MNSITKNNFKLLKRYLNDKELETLFKNFIYVLQNHYKIKRKFKDFSCPKLNYFLLKQRNINPEKFGSFYDKLNLSFFVRHFFYKSKFNKFFNNKNIFINGFMFRMDAPQDKRNILDWHMDANYYKQTFPDFNSIVAIISLTDQNETNGCIHLVNNNSKKSLNHKIKNNKKNFSKTLITKVSKPDLKYEIRVPSKKGDLVILKMKTVHKSGYNFSNKFRISLCARIHQVDNKFNLGKEKYIFN